MNIHTFCSIFILNKPGGSIFEHESLNFQTSFEKESSQLNTSENAALKRRLAIFYSPRQHSLAHYCCKRSRWISCCAGQKDKLCLKEPKMWKTVRKRSLSHAAAQSTTTIGQFEEISWWIWNIHIKANTIIISFDQWSLYVAIFKKNQTLIVVGYENCIMLRMVVMSNTQRLERQVSSSAVELFLPKNEAPA